MVKYLLAMQETWVLSLGWKDLLEKEMAIHSSVLAWKIPWMEEPGRLQSMGLERVGHDWATSLQGCTGFKINWKGVKIIFDFTLCWSLPFPLFFKRKGHIVLSSQVWESVRVNNWVMRTYHFRILHAKLNDIKISNFWSCCLLSSARFSKLRQGNGAEACWAHYFPRSLRHLSCIPFL